MLEDVTEQIYQEWSIPRELPITLFVRHGGPPLFSAPAVTRKVWDWMRSNPQTRYVVFWEFTRFEHVPVPVPTPQLVHAHQLPPAAGHQLALVVLPVEEISAPSGGGDSVADEEQSGGANALLEMGSESEEEEEEEEEAEEEEEEEEEEDMESTSSDTSMEHLSRRAKPRRECFGLYKCAF
ncbi:hypothetical protein FRC17_001978 [Serendipita sp. 399]|nr:hypothetical protein FRC17_001978 [Serendipita sp. 399]